MKSLILLFSWIGLNTVFAFDCSDVLKNLLLKKQEERAKKEVVFKDDTFISVVRDPAENILGEVEEIYPDEIEEILDVAYKVNDLLVNGDDYLLRPRGLSLRAFKTIADPYFSPVGEKHISVGRYFMHSFGEHPFTINQKLTKNVTAHEYGHAIFDINMLRYLHGSEDFMKLFNAYNSKVNELQNLFEAILQAGNIVNQIISQFTPGFFKYGISKDGGLAVNLRYKDVEGYVLSKLEALPLDHPLRLTYHKAETQMDQLYEVFNLKQQELEMIGYLIEASPAYQNYKGIYAVSGGYNELFADVTAVLFDDNNPKAISDVLETRTDHELQNGMKAKSGYRDFSNPSNEISVWEPTTAIHNAFAPARYHLYSKYLSRDEFKGQVMKRKIYKKLFIAIRNELSYQYFNPIAKLDETELNKRLIAEIDRLMQE